MAHQFAQIDFENNHLLLAWLNKFLYQFRKPDSALLRLLGFDATIANQKGILGVNWNLNLVYECRYLQV